uniref:uncharacterized protein LOC124054327 isoform X3 n=1 Tax=Scatophagus argus TaxID=75038 RepID=UPI001ED83566|nr:uncharacterized protein LOC124054327 isoform X3 [Scatophagus argus]
MTGARTWLLLLLDFLLIGKTDFNQDGDVQAHLDCPKEVWGDLGQDVTLTCSLEPPQDVRIRTHEWEFNGSKRVLVYRSRRFSPRDQHDQFMGRVFVGSNLNLSEGRLSVRISKLTTDDSGTYSCHVRIGENQPSCSTKLRIVDPKEASENSNKTPRDTNSNDKNTGNSTAVTTGVSVGIIAIIIGIITAYCIWWRRRNCGTSAGCEATPLNRLGNDDSSRDTSG